MWLHSANYKGQNDRYILIIFSLIIDEFWYIITDQMTSFKIADKIHMLQLQSLISQNEIPALFRPSDTIWH